jgi:micrococcal nuclease
VRRKKRTVIVAALAVVVVVVASRVTHHASADASASTSTKTTVDRVIDGDTIVAKYNGQLDRVRFIGMDTPETVDPDKPVGCYGKQASDYTKSLLPKGTPIRMQFDADHHDKYGRLLAYIYRDSDDMFVNAQLVRQGYATVLTIPPNVEHVDEFTQLAAQARQQNLGLWSACDTTTSAK